MSSGVESRAPAVSLYVHVPFCVKRCSYCDFHSDAGSRVSRLIEPFVDAVLCDARDWTERGALADVPTLYLGGGTPALLGAHVRPLIDWLRARTGLRPDAEITVETNPEVTDDALVGEFVPAGVTRVSLGVQSFDDEVLRVLGRAHDAEAAETAARRISGSGVRLAVDIMCGVPGQSRASWKETVDRAVATGAGHVSVYPLSVEPATPLAGAIAAGTVEAPDADEACEMMLMASEMLASAGIERYEVANYARPGEESAHNLVYWTGGAYVGLGPSAAGMLPREVAALAPAEWGTPAQETARLRWVRAADTGSYLRSPLDHSADEVERLSGAQVAREDVMLGLRLTAGVRDTLVAEAGLGAVLEGLADSGLVERADGRWRTTTRGWLLGNEVFGAVWNAEHEAFDAS
jgi:oxygen-independent coproporphyrinogen-3 oxidase